MATPRHDCKQMELSLSLLEPKLVDATASAHDIGTKSLDLCGCFHISALFEGQMGSCCY